MQHCEEQGLPYHPCPNRVSANSCEGQKLDKDFYPTLPMLRDPYLKAAMIILDKLFYTAYLANNKVLLLQAVNVMIDITLNHGVSPLSSIAFSTLGIMTIGAMGNFQAAASFADTALLLQKRAPTKYYESVVVSQLNLNVMHWTNPIQNSMGPFLKSYNLGMQSGNLPYAMTSSCMYHVFLPFQIGKSLDDISVNLRKSIEQMDEFQQEDPLLMARILGQLILVLRGEQSQPSDRLDGELFRKEGWQSPTTNLTAILYCTEMQLYIYFGEFKKAASTAFEIKEKLSEGFPGFFFGTHECFFRGLSFYAMARQTNQAKFKRAGKRILNRIQSWLKKGNPNSAHYFALLSAEQAALDRDYENAEESYIQSIMLAARTGNLSHAALSNEQFADYYEKVHGNQEDANHRYTEASRFYSDWGAKEKVRQLGLRKPSNKAGPKSLAYGVEEEDPVPV